MCSPAQAKIWKQVINKKCFSCVHAEGLIRIIFFLDLKPAGKVLQYEMFLCSHSSDMCFRGCVFQMAGMGMPIFFFLHTQLPNMSISAVWVAVVEQRWKQINSWGSVHLLDKVSLFSKCCCSVCCLVFPPPPKLLKLGFGGTNAFQAAVVALLVFGWTTATGFHTAILLSTFTVS